MYSYYQQRKSAYLWIARNIDDRDKGELVGAKTFEAVITYFTKQQKALNSVEALRQYVIHNPDHVPEFEQSVLYDDQLLQLVEYESDITLDQDVLFAALLNTTRERWITQGLKYAQLVALGAVSVALSKGEEKQSGPTVAAQYIRSYLVNDFRPESAALAGLLSDNTDAVLANLEAKMVSQDAGGKVPLGLFHVDSAVTVGKQNLRLIGIAGMSGDGKTTLTNYIVYNWLTQGAHILYVSTEHAPEEVWEFMAFLHQSHADYDFRLPPLQHWENGVATGKLHVEDHRHMLTLLKDIKTRRNLPGLLDCQQMYDWETIKDYLTVNHRRNKYDILVVDYIGRLEVPGDAKYRDKAVGAMITDAQRLTREFDENKGIVILTPIQVNREGNKRAKAAEEGAPRYDLNAIAQNSESGYLLHATGYNLLWFDQRSERNRVYLHRLLSQSVEEFPA
jgi:RecA/RadA recombinase